jgi:quercetin dioxygenase-like cupin family protein
VSARAKSGSIGIIERLSVVGEYVRVLHSTNDDETGIELFEISGPRENGPPLHRHDWHECDFCLSGQIEFTIDGRTFLTEPGHVIDVPAGLAHGYRLLSDDAKMLSVTNGGGRTLEFFRDMHAGLQGAGRSASGLFDIASRVCANHGVEIMTPQQ